MLNIMSLNCNYCGQKHGPWDERLKLISSVMLEQDPDVVALQAILKLPDSPGQAWQIADLGRYRYRLMASAQHDQEGEKGQAVISRIPLAFADSMRLSLKNGHEDRSKRLVLASEVETKTGLLRVFNAHFSWVNEQTEDNIRETIDFMNKSRGMGLLIGDLNVTEESGLLSFFEKEGWRDAWKELRKDGPGHTFESHSPTMRIDYAWVNGPLRRHLKDIKVLRGESGDGRVRMSDHLALMLTLDI